MIGHEQKSKDESDSRSGFGEVVLSVSGIRQGQRLTDISFDVRAGEILGLAGLVGAGRSRLLKALAGYERIDDGRVTLKGRPFRPSGPAAAIRDGVGLLPEDRKDEGLFLEMSVATNIVFVRPPRRLGLMLWRRDEHRLVRHWLERLRIVAARASAPVASLSGGNQQKVLVARWLHADVDVLLIDEPGQGVDVASKEQIFQLIREAAASGKAVIVSASEWEELSALADRILVLRQGRIVGELAAAEATEEDIVTLATSSAGKSRR
jgi:ribose transport system ATP-binding protein